MYRYVCPNCLHTFLEEGRRTDLFCWKCGQHIIPIGKEEMQLKLPTYTHDPRRDLIERLDI